MIQDWLERLRAFWNASRRNQVIAAASGIVVIALLVTSIALLANRGGASANGAIAQATATTASTPAGTPEPTATLGPTATPLPTKPVKQAIIGGTEAGFTAAYGAPLSAGVDPANNQPTFTYKGNGPIGSISIELDGSHSFVIGVVVTAQKDIPWDVTTVGLVCPHFSPPDATYDQGQSITDQNNTVVAMYQLGHSPLLASSLPESVFTDNQGAPVAAGTFSIEIYYISGTSGKYSYACSLRLGDQPTSPA